MGFQVEVRQIVHHAAICCETGCHWVGPDRVMHGLAESDADEHIRLHYEAWENYNKAIEEAPEGAIVEYYDDLTYPALPRCSRPVDSDRPRFAYDALPSKLVSQANGSNIQTTP